MKKTSKIYILPTVMLGVTAVAGMVASVPGVNAEDISPVDDEITITVDSACTMGIMIRSSMDGIVPGETKNTGFYNMAAYCNDSNGYDIYAIGYTNGEYGNTDMISTNGNTIHTGTSGEDSYWNVRLTPGTATGQTTHIPTIVSPFTNNTAIPSDYTKVVTYPSTTIPQGTDPTESGSYFKASYYTHASTTQPAGIYTGQVQYVMVHPVGAPAPEAPLTMQNTAAIKRKLVNAGDTAQATDIRDGKEYWIAKLADGNIWMTQNLDLDIEAGRTYTSADTDLANSSISTTWTPTSSEATYPTGTTIWARSYATPKSYDPGDLYWNGALNQYWDGNLDNETVADPSATSGGTHYHIGNYYNWTAAVAMSNSSSYASQYTDVNQSICPAGWRLPTYSGNKSYENLVGTQSLTAGTSGNIQNTPTYFVYGGGWNGKSNSVGSSGSYWSSVVLSSLYSYMLNFGVYGSLGPQANSGRDYGYSLRCVAR